MKHRLLILILLVFSVTTGKAEEVIIGEDQSQYLGKKLTFFRDTAGLGLKEVMRIQDYSSTDEPVPNLGLSDDVYWFKLKLENNTDHNDWKLYLAYPILDDVRYYFTQDGVVVDSLHYSEGQSISDRSYIKSDYIFDIDLDEGETAEVYLRIQTSEQLIVPLELRDTVSLWTKLNTNSLLNGLYAGIIFIMLVYNLFIYFTVRDSAYIYYVLYLLFIGLTQLGIKGVVQEYIFPDANSLKAMMLTIFGALGASFGVLFTRDFLKTRREARLIDHLLRFTLVGFLLSIILALFSFKQLAFTIMQSFTTLSALLILSVAIMMVARRKRTAKYFLIAWSVLVTGAIVFLLKDFGVLPYNTLTDYSVQLSSGAEVLLLSFALADRINILKREKEESQARELMALQENERIIKEQNTFLEQKVEERTKDLNEAKQKVEKALTDLQNAQAQLVSAEKMASLGQLTAGIAHEINNPINFVTSNIIPLTQDIQDLKDVLERYEKITEPDELKSHLEEIAKYRKKIDFDFTTKEIDDLLRGISEGAKRTSEIVKGLKNFSRLDESEFKKADIHEGLESTLIILRSSFKEKIEVICDFDRSIGKFECFPGKLNQVFSNLISNAVQAIMDNLDQINEPKINIITTDLGEKVKIVISDNGPGIPKEIQDKIFDPFFTTKEVGEGTGLGLSIVYSIIETHHGNLELNSEPGKGTSFEITLPKTLEA